MLLPDPKRRGEIHFVFAKSMPYGRRLRTILLFLLLGFSLQIFFNSLIFGAAMLLVASLIGVVKGYTNIPEQLGSKREWQAGEKDHLLKIVRIADKTKSWDQSMIDISCVTGFLCLLAIGGMVFLAFLALCMISCEFAAFALVADTAVLLLPHWITGVRRILVNAPLVVKVQNLLNIYALWESLKLSDEKMTVQLEVVKDGKDEKGDMPVDAKLILQIPALGESFFGVQTQVVLNNVQGNDYPYVYCVLVARKDFKLKEKIIAAASKSEAPQKDNESFWSKLFTVKPPEVITEWSGDKEMDVLIIRQQTTKQTGYHTDSAAVSRIFNFAHAKARSLLK